MTKNPPGCIIEIDLRFSSCTCGSIRDRRKMKTTVRVVAVLFGIWFYYHIQTVMADRGYVFVSQLEFANMTFLSACLEWFEGSVVSVLMSILCFLGIETLRYVFCDRAY